MAAATCAATASTMRVRRIWTKRMYHIQGNPRGAALSVMFAKLAMMTISRRYKKIFKTWDERWGYWIQSWEWLDEEMLLICEAPPDSEAVGYLPNLNALNFSCRTRICNVGFQALLQRQPTTVKSWDPQHRKSARAPSQIQLFDSIKQDQLQFSFRRRSWPWKPLAEYHSPPFCSESFEQAIWVTWHRID